MSVSKNETNSEFTKQNASGRTTVTAMVCQQHLKN